LTNLGAQPPRPAASSLRPYFVVGSRHWFSWVVSPAAAVVAAGVVTSEPPPVLPSSPVGFSSVGFSIASPTHFHF